MTLFFSWAVLGVFLYLSGCTTVTPPSIATPYLGKPTHFILAGQAPPVPAVTEVFFFRVASWPTNPVPFWSVAFCPLTVGASETVGCLHAYWRVKIDPTLTQEYWAVYHGDRERYVYEFRDSEQSAFGWHRLDRVCVWTNMARC